MKLSDLQVIGDQLALKWKDGHEQFIALDQLRKVCPCASCSGEIDVMGQMHKGPDAALSEPSFQVNHLQMVGGYAVQIFWKDGHSAGLYSFDLLQQLHSND
tara:strand:- start:229 stop:531 length:303 start_codon:yes stop_codon:yes gene_type:complete